jgi:hypothetical protein
MLLLLFYLKLYVVRRARMAELAQVQMSASVLHGLKEEDALHVNNKHIIYVSF